MEKTRKLALAAHDKRSLSGDGDIAICKGRAIEPFPAFLIGQLDEVKPFGWKVEGAMKPP